MLSVILMFVQLVISWLIQNQICKEATIFYCLKKAILNGLSTKSCSDIVCTTEETSNISSSLLLFCSIFTQLWKDVFRHQIVRRSTAKGVTLLPLKKAIKLTLDLYRRRIWTMQMTSEYLYIFIFVSPILLQSENLVIVLPKPDPAKAKLPLLPILKIQRKAFA